MFVYKVVRISTYEQLWHVHKSFKQQEKILTNICEQSVHVYTYMHTNVHMYVCVCLKVLKIQYNYSLSYRL